MGGGSTGQARLTFDMSPGSLSAIEESGVPVVDNFIGGEPFGMIDNYTLYKLSVPEDRHAVPTATWHDLLPLLEGRVPDHRARWAVVLYTPIGAAAVSHTAIFDTLLERFKKFDIALVVAELNLSDRAVLIRKRDGKAFPDLSIACMAHSTWNFARGNSASHKRAVLTFAQFCGGSRK